MAKNDYVNPLPGDVLELINNIPGLLNNYLEEYRLIIETQMHFNDLIIRFRSFTLTAYTTIFAGILALSKLEIGGDLDSSTILLLLIIPNLLWFSAFIIDLTYYHRMLNGAVMQARKYDDSNLKELGLFGMTTAIGNKAKKTSSRILVVFYYLFPAIGFILTAINLYQK